MSSTILHELQRAQRVLTRSLAFGDPELQHEFEYDRMMQIQEAGLYDRCANGQRVDAVMFLRGSLPYRRHCEESEREYLAQQAAGGREICPQCNHRSVVRSDVKTLGVPGHSHPGDEFSVYRQCERDDCDYAEL